MVLFACLICKEEFYPDEHYHLDKEEEKKTPVLTICGHYFHLTCLQAAFVHETVATCTKRLGRFVYTIITTRFQCSRHSLNNPRYKNHR